MAPAVVTVDGWIESGVAQAVAIAIVTLMSVNVAMVLFLCLRRGANALARTYTRRRERVFTEVVFGTLLVPPDRSAFSQTAHGLASRLPGGQSLAFHDRTIRPRPGDGAILERMFLRLARELRGADRETMTGIFEDAGYVKRQLLHLRSRHWWRRLDATRRLGIMRSDQATMELLNALEDPDRDVRLGALRALGEVSDERSYDRLLRAMEEETRWESALIAEVVLVLGSGISAPIRSRLTATRDVSLQAGYARLLGMLRDPLAVSSLVPLLERDDPHLKIEVVRALGRIGDSRVAGTLIPYLDNSQPVLRREAAMALGRIEEPDAIAPLLRRLEDPELSVRYGAAVALSDIGPLGSEALRRAADGVESPGGQIARQVIAERDMGFR